MEATSPQAPVKRGFAAPCPRCGEAKVMIALEDLNELHCYSCDEDFHLEDIRTLIASWAAVLAWIDSAPALED